MKYFLVDAGRNVISKKIEDGLTSSGLTLTNNEIKYITKVNRCLENRLLLKRASRKLTSQEGGFLNFLRPLMSASLPIMKNKLTTLAQGIVHLLKIVKSLEKLGLQIKAVSETTKNEAKEQKGGSSEYH